MLFRSYDIIILDIFMGKLLGIEVAKNLRKLKFNGEIIFLTVLILIFPVQRESPMMRICL